MIINFYFTSLTLLTIAIFARCVVLWRVKVALHCPLHISHQCHHQTSTLLWNLAQTIWWRQLWKIFLFLLHPRKIFYPHWTIILTTSRPVSPRVSSLGCQWQTVTLPHHFLLFLTVTDRPPCPQPPNYLSCPLARTTHNHPHPRTATVLLTLVLTSTRTSYLCCRVNNLQLNCPLPPLTHVKLQCLFCQTLMILNPWLWIHHFHPSLNTSHYN